VTISKLLHLLCGSCDADIFLVAQTSGTSHDIYVAALAELFGHIEKSLERLMTYTKVLPKPEMQEVIVKAIIEVLSILGVATKAISQEITGESITGDGQPLLAHLR
jgi:hypothetical protein